MVGDRRPVTSGGVGAAVEPGLLGRWLGREAEGPQPQTERQQRRQRAGGADSVPPDRPDVVEACAQGLPEVALDIDPAGDVGRAMPISPGLRSRCRTARGVRSTSTGPFCGPALLPSQTRRPTGRSVPNRVRDSAATRSAMPFVVVSRSAGVDPASVTVLLGRQVGHGATKWWSGYLSVTGPRVVP